MIVLPRLYAIVDTDLTAARGFDPHVLVQGWLDAGVRLIQLRAKRLTGGPMLAMAGVLADRCHAAGAIFIVNDRADVARLSGADGVHVGQTDLTPVDARTVVGETAVVGVSTHNDEQLRDAVDAPVTYVATGPVYSTSSKDRPDPVVGLDGVRRAAAIAGSRSLPIVAIGGITLDRAPEVIAAGASAVAVIADLLDPDPAARARSYLRALR